MPSAGFVHLHVHSAYSLLKGSIKIAKLAELAKKVKSRVLEKACGGGSLSDELKDSIRSARLVLDKGLAGAINLLMMMTSSPLQWHKSGVTRDAADKWYEDQVRSRTASTDANDMLYQFNASRDYDPSSHLEKITAAVLAINSADDVVNPPELGLMEKLMPRVKRGRYVLIPTSDQTRGHGTHSIPTIWGKHLEEFLKNLEPGT